MHPTLETQPVPFHGQRIAQRNGHETIKKTGKLIGRWQMLLLQRQQLKTAITKAQPGKKMEFIIEKSGDGTCKTICNRYQTSQC